MEDQEIKKMSIAEIAKYIDEQKRLGKVRERTQEEIAEIRGVSKRTLLRQVEPFRDKEEHTRTMSTQRSTNEIQEMRRMYK